MCERHLDNVGRINKAVEIEIAHMKEVNLQAIKKLQQPVSGRSCSQGTPFAKWENSSLATDYETGEINWGGERKVSN